MSRCKKLLCFRRPVGVGEFCFRHMPDPINKRSTLQQYKVATPIPAPSSESVQPMVAWARDEPATSVAIPFDWTADYNSGDSSSSSTDTGGSSDSGGSSDFSGGGGDFGGGGASGDF